MNKFSIIRGDIVVFDFGNNTGSVQCGKRPAVVLQNDILNASSPAVIIAPITSAQKPQMPAHVILGRRFGLYKESSMVLLEQIRTVSKSKLVKRIGHINDEGVMHLIDKGLCETLGIQSGACPSDDSSSEEVPV